MQHFSKQNIHLENIDHKNYKLFLLFHLTTPQHEECPAVRIYNFLHVDDEVQFGAVVICRLHDCMRWEEIDLLEPFPGKSQ